jgi:hypothetical protein
MAFAHVSEAHSLIAESGHSTSEKLRCKKQTLLLSKRIGMWPSEKLRCEMQTLAEILLPDFPCCQGINIAAFGKRCKIIPF